MNGVKACANGHQMDPSWKVCPYCRSDQPAMPPPPPTFEATVRDAGPPPPPPSPPGHLGATVREAVPTPAAAAATVREAGPPPRPPGPGGPERRTMRLSLVNVLARAWLVPLDGPQKGQDFKLDEAGGVAGAGDGCKIRLVNDFASGRHLQFRFDDGRFVVQDLRSTNGTLLNGEPVGETSLADGDRLTIGKTDYVFKCLVVDGGSGRP